MEIISKLGIDVKLIIAQVAAFIILFFALRKLLYGPLLNVLQKRKEMIAKSVEDAERIEKKLNEVTSEKELILKEASANAMAALEKSKKEAEEERAKIIALGKKEIASLAERYRDQLKSEKEEMYRELKGELAGLIVSSCEKILRKEFSGEDQKRLEGAIKNEISSVKF
ncbi:MAG: F0F1 ATP synthase subunit B [Patescibacteria group bacterium]